MNDLASLFNTEPVVTKAIRVEQGNHQGKELTLYRYTDNGDASHLFIEEWPVYRQTNACYVINYFGFDKFVIRDPNGRRFAYAELKDALHSYRKRKVWQQSHARQTMDRAVNGLRFADLLIAEGRFE